MAKAVAVDANGNILLTGSSLAALDFGGGAVVNAAGAGTYDIFIAKFSPSGTNLWSKCAGGLFDDSGDAITRKR
jgi:hypothetical protein